MRNGWRKLLAVLGSLVLSGSATAAHFDAASGGSDRPIRLTIEVAWSTAPTVPIDDAGEVELEVSEGQVVEAVPWPLDSGSGVRPERKVGTVWRLGAERTGRVRARVEAPVGASLLLHARGQALRFPLPLVLEGPQRAPPQSSVEISVERVPWDVVAVSLGRDRDNSGDGLAAPGSRVPVTVGFNILTPEGGEVALRCTAELRPVRGGEPVWRTEIRETVPTNAASAPSFVVPVQMPEDEGTYVLELAAAWEPAPTRDGNKLIGRLIRRGKRGWFGAASASRRTTLAVVASAGAGKAGLATPGGRGQEVDALDLTRPRGLRPMASGRSALVGGTWPLPEEARVEATRRDRLRGWIARVGSEVVPLGPVDPAGLAWSAVGLKVAHPGRPHRLTVTVAGGPPEALGVALVGTGARDRVLLDARASGPTIARDGPAATFSWLVWPGTADPVLVLTNWSAGASVQVGAVTLAELAEVPDGPAVEEPRGVPVRGLGLYLGGADLLERFGAATDSGLTDALAAARNLGAYLNYCGATAVVLPEGLADRAQRGALDGTAAEDATGPDRLDLTLRVLGARSVAAWLELSFAGALPGLPAPETPEALTRGLTRVDRRGRADGPAYNPLNAEVRDAIRRRVAEAVAARKAHAHLAGVLIRLGPGPTLLGGPDTGFDDATYSRFVRETFDSETTKGVPGLAVDDPGRFDARSRFLAGSGRVPWLTWRSKRVAALYAELAEAARGASLSADLAVVTPGPNDGPAGAEARRADVAGLAPSLAWRAVGLDLDAWPAGDAAPIVARGVGLGPDELAHDLATHPELDAKVAARSVRGLLIDAAGEAAVTPAGTRTVPRATLAAPAVDGGPNGDEPLGHALATLDPRWVWVSASAVAGHEDRLRRFARVFRAVPASPASDRVPLAFGVAVRAHRGAGATYLSLANDTPYPVRLDAALAAPTGASVYDLGRGAWLRPGSDASGRHLVLDLLPFGAAAARVGAADVTVTKVTPYPSDIVLTGIRARHDALSEQLSRLTRGEKDKDRANPCPLNPGFEPGAASDDPSAKDAPVGWKAVGGPGVGAVVDRTRPHSGRGALRLDAPAAPASVVSENFTPNAHASLLVRAWLRADRPDVRVRLWIEGESAGVPYRRVSDLDVPSAWSERSIRASDVPRAGLDAARLRFELLTPGPLWVDDLSVAGEALSEPERRNARNALLAALQAFREERYADFARLAGSHWARPSGVADPATAAADRSAIVR